MRARLLDVALVLLVLCALTVTGLVVRREWLSRGLAAAAAPRPSVVPGWRSFAREGHRMGPANAAVTVVVFSDFECRFCGLLDARLRALRAHHPREVAVVYRHFPLAKHSEAVAAARASECAADQGRFPEFERAVFSDQDSLGVAPWEYFARKAGLPDLVRFRGCASAEGPIAALDRDVAAGHRLAVDATPTFLVNELRVVGVPPQDTLEAYVRRHLPTLAGGRAIPASE